MVKRVNVAAAVVMDGQGRFLLGQRAAETYYPGYWEFPGGKVEPGETPHQAVIRELDEELGIAVHTAYPWIAREHHYEHAHVTLHFFEVADWSGQVQDHVHNALAWQRADALEVGPMLPANGPILKALRLPRVMGVTDAAGMGIDVQLRKMAHALQGGLRLIQLREPALDDDNRRRFAAEAAALARDQGACLLINGDARLAERVGAQGLHLPARQLVGCTARPDFEWVGASCHSREELEQAAALALDYAVLGPVLPTASHPGKAGLGWAGFSAVVAELPIPVFAIGGLTTDSAAMDEAKRAGAHGIAALRAAWA